MLIIIRDGKMQTYEAGEHPFAGGDFVTLDDQDRIVPAVLFPSVPIRGVVGESNGRFNEVSVYAMTATPRASMYWDGEFAVSNFDRGRTYRPFDPLFLWPLGMLSNDRCDGCRGVGWVTQRPSPFPSLGSDPYLSFRLDIRQGLGWEGRRPSAEAQEPTPEPAVASSGGRWDEIV